MKKTLIVLLISLILTGCSTNNSNQVVNKSKEDISAAKQAIKEGVTQNEDTSLKQNSSEVQAQETQVPDIGLPTNKATSQNKSEYKKDSELLEINGKANANKTSNIDKNWFSGCIGNAKIHAKFDIKGNKASGVYYYDQYKTNIELQGYINDLDEMKEFQTISLTEDTDKKGKIKGVFRTNDYFEGCWKSGDVIYPMYLIREGSDITPPKQPSVEIMKLDGNWTGINSGYFGGSQVNIKVLFYDLIYYELNAFNGLHTGMLESFGIVNNNVAKTVFKDTTYGEKKDNVLFEFKIENDSLKLNSNKYDYSCGMGVGFDSEFVKGKIKVAMPTALQLGIVETKGQDEVFKKLVGDKYSEFIAYTSYIQYSETILDGENVKVGYSQLRGAFGYCSYIISSKHIYAAIIGNEKIHYYTNDKNYANKIPEPMAKWAENIGEIVYNYKE